MSREDAVTLAIIAVMIAAISVGVLGRLWAHDWDARCLVAECRIVK